MRHTCIKDPLSIQEMVYCGLQIKMSEGYLDHICKWYDMSTIKISSLIKHLSNRIIIDIDNHVMFIYMVSLALLDLQTVIFLALPSL